MNRSISEGRKGLGGRVNAGFPVTPLKPLNPQTVVVEKVALGVVPLNHSDVHVHVGCAMVVGGWVFVVHS